MAEQTNTKSAISRRSARVYSEEHDGSVELASVGQVQGQGSYSSDSRYGSGDERADRENTSRKRSRSLSGSGTGCEDGMLKRVDLGRDTRGLFPSTFEEVGKQVTKSLQSAKDKIEGRPLNFGTIIPGAVYRSSFPVGDDHAYLASLGLKSVITLVDKEYPPEFKPFLKANGIQHFVIDMKGTKKVAIPEGIMHSILDIALDKANHPTLIHCNHGKHRTGCAAAVIRHIAGWKVQDIVDEYSAYAEPKIRECDLKYITDYEAANLEGLFLRPHQNSHHAHHNPALDPKMVQYLLGALFLIFLCIMITIFLRR